MLLGNTYYIRSNFAYYLLRKKRWFIFALFHILKFQFSYLTLPSQKQNKNYKKKLFSSDSLWQAKVFKLQPVGCKLYINLHLEYLVYYQTVTCLGSSNTPIKDNLVMTEDDLFIDDKSFFYALGTS